MSFSSFLNILSPKIEWLTQSREENCVQTVIAIALGLSTECVEEEARTNGTMSVHETLELLAQLGVSVRPIAADLASNFWGVFYKRGGGRRMRGLGFQLPRSGEGIGHAFFLTSTVMYDPATGKRQNINPETIKENLDWLVFLPEEAYDNPAIKKLRSRTEF